MTNRITAREFSVGVSTPAGADLRFTDARPDAYPRFFGQERTGSLLDSAGFPVWPSGCILRDHAPPHFHALYGEEEAVIDIQQLAIIRGRRSPRALGLVMEWTAIH